jgi:hypothetical protein
MHLLALVQGMHKKNAVILMSAMENNNKNILCVNDLL